MQKLHACRKEPGGRSEATKGRCRPQLLEGRNHVEDPGQENKKRRKECETEQSRYKDFPQDRNADSRTK